MEALVEIGAKSKVRLGRSRVGRRQMRVLDQSTLINRADEPDRSSSMGAVRAVKTIRILLQALTLTGSLVLAHTSLALDQTVIELTYEFQRDFSPPLNGTHITHRSYKIILSGRNQVSDTKTTGNGEIRTHEIELGNDNGISWHVISSSMLRRIEEYPHSFLSFDIMVRKNRTCVFRAKNVLKPGFIDYVFEYDGELTHFTNVRVLKTTCKIT
jgi:hypothetical protein